MDEGDAADSTTVWTSLDELGSFSEPYRAPTRGEQGPSSPQVGNTQSHRYFAANGTPAKPPKTPLYVRLAGSDKPTLSHHSLSTLSSPNSSRLTLSQQMSATSNRIRRLVTPTVAQQEEDMDTTETTGFPTFLQSTSPLNRHSSTNSETMGRANDNASGFSGMRNSSSGSRKRYSIGGGLSSLPAPSSQSFASPNTSYANWAGSGNSGEDTRSSVAGHDHELAKRTASSPSNLSRSPGNGFYQPSQGPIRRMLSPRVSSRLAVRPVDDLEGTQYVQAPSAVDNYGYELTHQTEAEKHLMQVMSEAKDQIEADMLLVLLERVVMSTMSLYNRQNDPGQLYSDGIDALAISLADFIRNYRSRALAAQSNKSIHTSFSADETSYSARQVPGEVPGEGAVGTAGRANGSNSNKSGASQLDNTLERSSQDVNELVKKLREQLRTQEGSR